MRNPIPTALAVLLPLAWSQVHAQDVQTPGGAVVPAPAQDPAPRRAAPPALPPVASRAVRDSLLRDAEALRERRQWIQALALYEHLLAADARDDVAYRMRALTLADLGAARLAADLLRAWPEAFADYQRDRIEGDEAARMVGWGDTLPERADAPTVEMEAALANLQALQQRRARTNWEKLRLRMDSLQAYNGLRRYADTVREYEALQREGHDLPAYVHGPAGDAYMALRRPEDAERALRRALELNPGDVDSEVLLGYSLIEQERFADAFDHMERAQRRQPPFARREGAKASYENWDRYKVDIPYALMASYAHDHAAAHRLLDGYVRIAPRHAYTQSALGAVLHRQLKPTAALERYRIAHTLDPRSRDAAIGQANVLFDLQRTTQARAQLADTVRRFPDDPQVRRLQRESDIRLGPRGRIGWVRGRNDGDATLSQFGSRDQRIEAEAFGPLWNDRWRLGLMADDLRAEFTPDTARYQRVGPAVDYRHHDWTVRAAAFAVRQPADDTAWLLDARYRLADAWTLRGALAGDDVETPLQARRAGVTADSATLGATWTPSDLAWLHFEARHMRFNDGNRRTAIGATARRRFHSAPHLLIDGLAGLYASRNTADGRPYFNPASDHGAWAGLRFDHIIWRRYERHLRHRLDLVAGQYSQDGYGSAFVPSVAYRHEWQPALGHVFEYGISWSRPVYDGAREERFALEASYRWGF